MTYMNWFEMKEYYDDTRDDCGLTAEDRAEQLEMMREDFEGIQNSVSVNRKLIYSAQQGELT